MKITIGVTQDDIDNGVPCKSGDCPVFHAVSRALPGCQIAVGMSDVVLADLRLAHGYARVTLPQSARDFIEAFDMDTGEPIAPFSFDLEIPDELAPAGGAS